MKLYVPEISDSLMLTADWTFELHPEYRNVALGTFFGFKVHHNGWTPLDKGEQPVPDYKVIYPEQKRDCFSKESYDDWQKRCRQAELDCPEYVKYREDYRAWKEEADKAMQPQLIVTIPKGTTLTVDRIYIRKGSSEYSSITFYAKNLGEVVVKSPYYYSRQKPRKMKALRFWSKLSDCNNIEFEKI